MNVCVYGWYGFIATPLSLYDYGSALSHHMVLLIWRVKSTTSVSVGELVRSNMSWKKMVRPLFWIFRVLFLRFCFRALLRRKAWYFGRWKNIDVSKQFLLKGNGNWLYIVCISLLVVYVSFPGLLGAHLVTEFADGSSNVREAWKFFFRWIEIWLLPPFLGKHKWHAWKL